MMMMMMMMNCFGGMVGRQKVFSLICGQDQCQRISDMPWAGFEPVQNLKYMTSLTHKYTWHLNGVVLLGHVTNKIQMHQHHSRQGADFVVEAPKHDPLIKWPTWGHMTIWKIYISIFMRFIANKFGRLLTVRRIFTMQMLKSSLTSCWIVYNTSLYPFQERLLSSLFEIFLWALWN